MLRLLPPIGRPYRVEIQYREPTYERATGNQPKAYSWTYVIRADTEDEARAWAVNEFKRIERLSSVGWIREIVGMNVSLAA